MVRAANLRDFTKIIRLVLDQQPLDKYKHFDWQSRYEIEGL